MSHPYRVIVAGSEREPVSATTLAEAMDAALLAHGIAASDPVTNVVVIYDGDGPGRGNQLELNAPETSLYEVREADLPAGTTPYTVEAANADEARTAYLYDWRVECGDAAPPIVTVTRIA